MVKFSCTKERNLIKICFNNIANLDKIRILFKSTKNSPMSKSTDIAPNDKIPERYDHLKKNILFMRYTSLSLILIWMTI